MNPTLRFQTSAGEAFPDWEAASLADLATVVTGSGNREDSSSEGDYLFFDRSADDRYTSDYAFDCEAIIVAGESKDFAPRYYNGKFGLHQRVYAVHSFNGADGKYLYYYIGHHKGHFLKTSVGTTMPSLRMNSFHSFPIALPSLPEQRRIADALSAVDTKIDLLTRKRDNLARFKAGLMQKIFSQEVRFTREDGSAYPDWEEKEVGELLSYQQPTPYLVESSDYDDGAPTPVLTAGKTFILGYTFEKSGVYEALPAIIFDDFTTASRYVDFPFKAKSSAMKMLTARNSEDSCLVIYEAMMQIDYEISGHKRHWISEYQYLPIFLPSSEEQKHIENAIESLDVRIAFSDQQIATMQSFKKGLLQQMFV